MVVEKTMQYRLVKAACNYACINRFFSQPWLCRFPPSSWRMVPVAACSFGSSRACTDAVDLNGVRVEKVDRCVVLRMERGENRVNREFVKVMNQALDVAESYEDATAVITTGKEKFYSLGLDLEEVDSSSSQQVMDDFNAFESLLSRILTFPLVTISAINGHVYAAGAFFAMVHDYRVMRSEKGWLCFPEVNIKRDFTVGMYSVLKATLPQPALHKAAALGWRYTAEEAKDAKIVDEVCAMSELEEAAFKAAMRLAGKEGLDRAMLASIKQNLYRDTITTLSQSARCSSGTF